MSRKLIISALILAFSIAGCATSAKKVKVEQQIPEPQPGEVAVFGGIRLVEDIMVFRPNEEQDGSIYLESEQEDRTIKIACSDGGNFGVYLQPGTYRLVQVDVDDYTFHPNVRLNVIAGYKAVYAGVIELDGSPTGVDPDSGDTIFVYSILDESEAFMDRLRKEAPGSEREVFKSLFTTDGALSTGSYPTKVRRAEDIRRDLAARTSTVEEVVSGGIIVLSYVINPVWLFTLP